MSETSEFNWYSNEAATFGDRVAAARETQSMTQKELARRLGIAQKTLEGWENDVAEPRANKLQMLAGVLNVSMPWLLTGEGPGLESDPVAADIAGLMSEMRTLRTEMLNSAERLGRIEKRLKLLVSEQAE